MPPWRADRARNRKVGARLDQSRSRRPNPSAVSLGERRPAGRKASDVSSGCCTSAGSCGGPRGTWGWRRSGLGGAGPSSGARTDHRRVPAPRRESTGFEPLAPSDETTRLVLAGAYQGVGRERDAGLLRDLTRPVASVAGCVVEPGTLAKQPSVLCKVLAHDHLAAAGGGGCGPNGACPTESREVNVQSRTRPLLIDRMARAGAVHRGQGVQVVRGPAVLERCVTPGLSWFC